MKMQGLDKQAFMKVFADLKTFPKVSLTSQIIYNVFSLLIMLIASG